MRNFDNHSDTDIELDEFNNQTTNNYGGYNNYNNYYNNNNDLSNSVYGNGYNKNLKNPEEFHKQQKRKM